MASPDITNTLVNEGLIDKQLDAAGKNSYAATRNYFQRLIDSEKQKLKN